MDQDPIFYPYEFGDQEREVLERDGHFMLPGIITSSTCERLTKSLTLVQPMRESRDERVRFFSFYAAEYDAYLASLIAHPQMLDLARRVLGPEIRFDHCVPIVRPPSHGGFGWHSHEYADDRSELGLMRIFFYINGFSADDAGLKVVPGSHHYRDSAIEGRTDEDLGVGWLAGKEHPLTGEGLEVQALEAPLRTVILMWTHAAHAVSARNPDSPTRWAVVYGYRNPGAESSARCVTTWFEQQHTEAASLMSLY